MHTRLYRLLVLTWISLLLFLWGCSSKNDHLKTLEQGIAEVLGNAGPSVVSISVRNEELSVDRLGSGVIIEESYILTVENLLQNADEITIKLQDGTQIMDSNIYIHGCDFETNLSLLQIEKENLKPTKMAQEIKNGSLGIVLGNTEYSKGLQVNLGTIGNSWIGGVDGYDDNLLIFTAPCTPYHPGTPVFNSKAELVGLIEGKIEGEENVVLLVPATTMSQASQILKKDGEIKRGWIGILSAGMCKRKRAVVEEVVDGSPAQKAGLKKGDMVVACDGIELQNGVELKRMISKFQKGTSIRLKVLRQGKERELELTVEWAKNLPRKRRCPDRSI